MDFQDAVIFRDRGHTSSNSNYPARNGIKPSSSLYQTKNETLTENGVGIIFRQIEIM